MREPYPDNGFFIYLLDSFDPGVIRLDVGIWHFRGCGSQAKRGVKLSASFSNGPQCS